MSSASYLKPAFAPSQTRFDSIVQHLSSTAAGKMEHGDIEEYLASAGRDLLRSLLQDRLDLRREREPRLEGVEGADRVLRTRLRERKRDLETVFGKVEVHRLACSAPEAGSLCPRDAELNLPRERHSDGLRLGIAAEAARGSFEEAVKAVERATGVAIPKRQAEQPAQRASSDFEAFYASRKATTPDPAGDPLVLSLDGKGIVMRKEALREETRKEAERRDPEKKRPWAVLVDGDPHQIGRIRAQARRHGVIPALIPDFIHVLEYLWDAARIFHSDGERPEAATWVGERAIKILEGRCTDVAAGIRRSATLRGLRGQARKTVDTSADYLLDHVHMMQCQEYLARGLPVATGVIEGACRHLVKDRMDITGARWGLRGAEAVLRLRSLRSSGDFAEYWRFHQRQEYLRNHASRYASGARKRGAA